MSKVTAAPDMKEVFHANGYLDSVIKKTSAHTYRQGDDEEKDGESEKPKILYLPYVKGLLETIQRMCRRMGVKTVFRSHGMLRELLMKVKTRIPEENKRDIVYQIPCLDCESSYIGETGRKLKKRITEHKAAVRRGDKNSGIAVHVWEQQHHVDWEGAKIIDFEPHYTKRRVLEAVWIHKTKINSNLDCGLPDLDTIFISLDTVK